ncbi:MAG: tRNA intron endonuclease [Cenarchaeum symbiont of Oopsacas minuta]|nr:tRNA intron endonuclease [Cenarchaeum symbiont of Oopsacas minuta]
MKKSPNMLMDDEHDEPVVAAVLRGTVPVVHEKSMQDLLRSRGYGEEDGDRYILRPFEALYLLYKGSLSLKKAGKIIGFDSLMRIYKSEDGGAFTDYLIYRDLRSRGYMVRKGFGFGSDFLVYERGDFGQKGAKYSVFGFREGSREKIRNLQKKIHTMSKMGKEPIIAVIERRGEIIYYKVSTSIFTQNIKKME